MFNGMMKISDVATPLDTEVHFSFEHHNVSPELAANVMNAMIRNEDFGLRNGKGRLMILSPNYLGVIHPTGVIQKAATVQQFRDTVSMSLFAYKEFVPAKSLLAYSATIKQLLA